MAAGDYGYRARQISNDELGQLTTDFNHMANVLEENINKLEEENPGQEDFVAAFAHELKTPLTAIIGYADMLRSRKLDEEKLPCPPIIYIYGRKAAGGHVPAASGYHCHQEGGSAVPAGACRFPFDYLKDMFASHTEMEFHFIMSRYGEGRGQPDQSVLVNLLDKPARLRSQGSPCQGEGKLTERGYRFEVGRITGRRGSPGKNRKISPKPLHGG